MPIAEKQNSPGNLRLLIAQRQLYTEAKRLHLCRTLGTLVLVAAAPCALLLWPNSQITMAVTSGAWLLISRLILEGIESSKTKQAATVQEQSDMGLFGLPWNQILVGHRLSPELIRSADRAFHGKRDELENWYADTGNIPYPLDVLLCQRANLTWDWRLRRSYAWIVGGLAVSLFAAGIVLACVTNQRLIEYLLALFLPSLPAFLMGIEVVRKHLKSATEQESLAKEVLSLWELGTRNQSAVSIEQCRHIQDRIYILRKTNPLVPDPIYRWLRARYNQDMRDTVAELEASVKNAVITGQKTVS